jgi:hypothetical protein
VVSSCQLGALMVHPHLLWIVLPACSALQKIG